MVGNILKRHEIPPAPERKKITTWREFIRAHMDVLVAIDFFATEVWTWGGLVRHYVLFFIHVGSRWVYIAGMTHIPMQGYQRYFCGAHGSSRKDRCEESGF